MKEVTTRFYDQTFRGLDWDERVRFYRQHISCDSNDVHIAKIVNGLLQELKASHTGIFIKEDLKYWALNSIFSNNLKSFPVPFSGILPVQVGGSWYVKSILHGSPADKAGVKKGDKLYSINGRAFDALGFQKDKKSILELSSDGISIRKALINPNLASMQSHFISASIASEKIIDLEGQRIGYFHLWSGTHEKFLKALNSSLLHFKQKKVLGVLLDLRDGHGGANPEYLKLLTTDSYLNKIPKVILINEGVTSGKEWISALIKKNKIGTLVGTKTAGAFLAGAPFRLFGQKYFLYLAVAEFSPPDLGPIEGIGVSPDIQVEGCVRFCEGKDPQLDQALRVMKSILN